jgi:hypothetical protein
MFCMVEVVQDKKDKRGMAGKQGRVGKVDRVHMVWVKAEERAFYILGVDTMEDEWATAQNCNYHNIPHSILAYIYRYYNIFHNNLYCMDWVCNMIYN